MTRPSRAFIVLAATAVLTACTPALDRAAGVAQEPAGGGGSQSRVLNMAIRHAVANLVPKVQTSASQLTQRWFNAALTITDEGRTLRPFLAEVPQLNTDTWRVFPDGRMETIYKLRPGLAWHDGQPLSAEDFVFAWRVYTNPALGDFTSSPQSLIEEVVAADPRTLVIRWRVPYPDANSLQMGDLDPLPRHLLDQPFASLQQTGPEAFFSLPYWLSEYVGAGPYRLLHYEPGSHYEGTAFDGYVLGRPKIDRVVLRIIPDEDAALTNMLAGSVDWAELRFEQGQLLLRDWVPAGKGVVLFNRGNAQSLTVQLKPEYLGHPALLDVRVRRALAHSLDRQAVNDGVLEGQGFMTESQVPDTEPFYPQVDRAIMHYPYDPRRTEQLMSESGFTKDRDGFFGNAAGERYWLGYQTSSGTDNERVQLILADSWKRAGVEVRPSILAAAQERQGEYRHTFPGIASRGASGQERVYTSTEIGTTENRWTGENRGGWSNVEYDRLYEALLTTLDRTERTSQFVQMQRLLSEQLPVFLTQFAVTSTMHIAALRGPMGHSTAAGTFMRGWDEPIHQWEWK